MFSIITIVDNTRNYSSHSYPKYVISELVISLLPVVSLSWYWSDIYQNHYWYILVVIIHVGKVIFWKELLIIAYINYQKGWEAVGISSFPTISLVIQTLWISCLDVIIIHIIMFLGSVKPEADTGWTDGWNNGLILGICYNIHPSLHHSITNQQEGLDDSFSILTW